MNQIRFSMLIAALSVAFGTFACGGGADDSEREEMAGTEEAAQTFGVDGIPNAPGNEADENDEVIELVDTGSCASRAALTAALKASCTEAGGVAASASNALTAMSPCTVRITAQCVINH